MIFGGRKGAAFLFLGKHILEPQMHYFSPFPVLIFKYILS